LRKHAGDNILYVGDTNLRLPVLAQQVSTIISDVLHQLRPIIRSLSVDVAKVMVQEFVSSRMDYCNCFLFGIADCLLRPLQAVQNAAARLITDTRAVD